MSLPNGVVPMERTHCGACENPDGTISVDMLIGLTCGGCGRHFHVGVPLLADKKPIFCPTCEGACLPADIEIKGDAP